MKSIEELERIAEKFKSANAMLGPAAKVFVESFDEDTCLRLIEAVKILKQGTMESECNCYEYFSGKCARCRSIIYLELLGAPNEAED